METIGQQLSKAREAKGMSVEDVVHHTRIRANVLHNIEGDDFSSFSSTAYAKGFIKKYGDFLGVDVSDAVYALESGTGEKIGKSDLDVVMTDSVKQEISRKEEYRAPKQKTKRKRIKTEKPGGAPVFLGFVLFALLASIAVFYFLGYNAESPDELKDEISGNLSRVGAGITGQNLEIEKNPFTTKKSVQSDEKTVSGQPSVSDPQASVSDAGSSEEEVTEAPEPTGLTQVPQAIIPPTQPEPVAPAQDGTPQLKQVTPIKPAQVSAEPEKILKAIPVIEG